MLQNLIHEMMLVNEIVKGLDIFKHIISDHLRLLMNINEIRNIWQLVNLCRIL